MGRTKRPLGQLARERLREAQQREAVALASVERAVAVRERARDRLAAAQVVPQRALDEAEQRLSLARGQLAEVSGVERAAMLLDESISVVRADMRARRHDEGVPREAATPLASTTEARRLERDIGPAR